MAARDLVSLIEGAWFGLPAAEEAEDEPSVPKQQAQRGSSSSLSDAPASDHEGGGSGSYGQRWPRTASSNRRAAPQAQGPVERYPGGLVADEDSGALGTWAGRQRVFSDHLREQEERGAVVLRPPLRAAPPPQQQGPAAPHRQNGASPPTAVPAPPAHRTTQPMDTSLDQEMNAAWRWRFTRKWQAEQMKQFEAAVAAGDGAGEDEEEWTEALRLMDAVDGGLNMQIGRTLSLQNSSGVGDGGSIDQSLTLLSPGLGQCVLLDGSVKESPLRDDASDATTQIVSMARKAQHLRRQQQEIERQVNERWEAASGGAHWAAQHLPAVQIDSWAAFPFVLVRLSEQRSQRQKLLVRGRNGATEQQAFASAEQEVVRVSVAHRLVGPRVELVATGRMEWEAGAADQRRTLRIRATRLLPPAAKDARLRSTAGVSGVVAELTRTSFPAGEFDIAGDGVSSSSSSGGSGPGRGAAGRQERGPGAPRGR